MMRGSYTVHPKDLDMPNTTFDRPDLSAFTRLDDLGLEVTGQRIEPDHAVLACRITCEDRWCRRCGCQGEARDTVVRRLAHEPYGWRPTILHVSVRRYRCPECAHVWRQDMSQAADPRAKLSRAAVHWALTGLVVHHLTVARIAQALGMSWNTANTADPAYSPRVSSTRYSICFPTTSTSPLRSPGASTRTSPDAYRSSNARGGKTLMHEEIARLNSTGMPSSLTELTTLGRTLKSRAADILAYFDHPQTSNGPTEAINGRLEHLRGSALGFRNLTHYITRALLETGGLKPQQHPQL